LQKSPVEVGDSSEEVEAQSEASPPIPVGGGEDAEPLESA